MKQCKLCLKWYDKLYPGRLRCYDCHKQKAREYYVANREKLCAYTKEWTARNKHRHTASKRASDVRTRRGAKECGCCNREAVTKFYLNRPEGYEIDHILPVYAGGLQCLKNLQYLTAKQHRLKTKEDKLYLIDRIEHDLRHDYSPEMAKALVTSNYHEIIDIYTNGSQWDRILKVSELAKKHERKGVRW